VRLPVSQWVDAVEKVGCCLALAQGCDAEIFGRTMSDLAYNKLIRALLADLAALNSQTGPTELCCMWFDDLYFPGQSLPAEYPRDIWERGQREWKDCFSTHELGVLAKFHEVFASQLDMLPTTSQWRQDAGWLSVSRAAGAALAELELR
jgi:hypothetical protein